MARTSRLDHEAWVGRARRRCAVDRLGDRDVRGARGRRDGLRHRQMARDLVTRRNRVAGRGDSLTSADSDIPQSSGIIGRFHAGATATAVFRLRRRAGGRCKGGAMLPDIRAVIAAMLAAVGLLMISFGAGGDVSRRAGDKPARCRPISQGAAARRFPAQSGERTIPIIDDAGSASRDAGRRGNGESAPQSAPVAAPPVRRTRRPRPPVRSAAGRDRACRTADRRAARRRRPRPHAPRGGKSLADRHKSMRRQRRKGQEGARRAHRARAQGGGAARRAGPPREAEGNAGFRHQQFRQFVRRHVYGAGRPDARRQPRPPATWSREALREDRRRTPHRPRGRAATPRGIRAGRRGPGSIRMNSSGTATLSACSRTPPSEMSEIQQSRGSEPVPIWILASPRIARRSLRRRFSASPFGLNFSMVPDTRTRPRRALRPPLWQDRDKFAENSRQRSPKVRRKFAAISLTPTITSAAAAWRCRSRSWPCPRRTAARARARPAPARSPRTDSRPRTGSGRCRVPARTAAAPDRRRSRWS